MNKEVGGIPSDVAKALQLGIITEEESKMVLKQMEDRDKKYTNKLRELFRLPPK